MMKIFRFTTMWVLLMAAAQMSAQQPIVWAEPVTIEPNSVSEVVLKIDLDTDEKITFWSFKMRLPEGVVVPEFGEGIEYNGKLIGDIERVYLSTDLYIDYDFVEENVIDLFTSKKTGIVQVLWAPRLLDSSPMKDTHGEMVRILTYSSLNETLTFTPEITDVTIITDKGETIVKDNELQLLPSHNTLYVDDTEALVGTEFTLSVKMRNEMDIEGFGFDLILPGGLMVVTDEEGNPMASLSEERTTAARTNTFSAVMRSNSYNEVLRVVAASSNGSAISAGDGEVCTVRVRVGTGLKAGEYSALLRNITLADTEARSHEMEEMWFKVNVLALEVGDANGDTKVNVADLTAIAHHVLGNTPEGFSEKAADANQDGQVNVADYTAVAHLLLYGNIYGPADSRQVTAFRETAAPAAENTLYIDPVQAFAGEELDLSVKMRNAVEAEGFQFTLRLPEGVSVVADADGFPMVSLSTERTTARRTDTFATAQRADGSLTVMAASTNGSTISGTDGEVCTVRVRIDATTAPGDYDLLLSDISISDTHAKSYDVAQMTATLTVGDQTAISDQMANAKPSNARLCDLQGRSMESSISNAQSSILRKGVYIRDGKKYVR